MSKSELWRRLNPVELDSYVEARLQLHYAAQLPASAASTLLPATDDDSHTALSFDAASETLLTGPIEGRETGVRIGIRIPTFELLLIDDSQQPITSLSLDGVSCSDGLQWLSEVFRVDRGSAISIPRRGYPDFPAHEIANGQPFRRPQASLLQTLANAYVDTASVLEAWRVSSDLPSSELRVWPHHFDIATLVTVSNDGSGQSMNLGLSPGDAAVPEAYWYVSPWPTPEHEGLPSDLQIGRWQETPWFGAIAPVSELLRATDQQSAIAAFFEQAADTAVELFETGRSQG